MVLDACTGKPDGRAMSPKDTFRIQSPGSPAISPDGETVLYTLSFRDMDSKDYKRTNHIWRININGSGNRQMTRGEESCSSPAWFPDGKKFAFLSSQGEQKEDEGVR